MTDPRFETLREALRYTIEDERDSKAYAVGAALRSLEADYERLKGAAHRLSEAMSVAPDAQPDRIELVESLDALRAVLVEETEDA